MTDRNTAFNRSLRADSNTIPWVNASEETVPAFGVIHLRENFSVVSQADKPDSGTGLFYTNGPVPVAVGKRGESRLWNKPQSVSVDGSVTVGDEIGPSDGSWKMSSAGSGFRVLRQDTDEVAIVERVGGAGGQSGINGIVREDLGHGYYLIEKSQWAGTTPTSTYVPGVGYDSSDCDPCYPLGSGSGSGSGSNCDDLTLADYVPQTIPLDPPQFVLGYSAAASIVSFVIGCDCVMLNLGDKNPFTASGSGSGPCSRGSGSGEDEPVYRIVDGLQTHIVEYKEERSCCAGAPTVITRQAIIWAGRRCIIQSCTECPE